MGGHGGAVEVAAGAHGGAGESGAIEAGEELHRSQAVGVGDAHRDLRGGADGGHGGLHRGAVESGSEVGAAAGIDRAGRAAGGGQGQERLARQAVEIEAGVQAVAAAQPLGAEAQGISAAGIRGDIGTARLEGGDALVIHVLGGAGSDDFEHGVTGGEGVVDHSALAVGADGAPGGGGAGGEAAVLDQLAVRGVDFLEADVVDQDFAAV